MRQGAKIALALSTAAPLMTGCGESDASPALVEGVTVDVVARDNVFEPEDIQVAAGTKVRFVNDGRNDHNVIPVDSSRAAVRVDTQYFAPGDEATRHLTHPGVYAYYCTIHGTATAGMTGTITVTWGTEE